MPWRKDSKTWRGKKPYFKSSKPDSAFIDENGKVSARTKGKSKFTAKVNGTTITINVVIEE